MDIVSQQQRSWNMGRIKGKNTGPELRVRSTLHRLGYRFRLHRSDLPGKPDIVMPGRAVVIFVHGCFWHRHNDCRNATAPSTRADFWERKFSETRSRDQRNTKALQELGWKVVVIWECETEDPIILNNRILTELADRN